MLEIFKLKKFYITLVIFIGIIFIILINFNRTYQAKTEILVIFKSEKAIRNADQILENLKLISQSLPFYEKVLADNEDAQEELILELPNYKKEKYWREIVKMERIGKSSGLEITAINQDAYTAQVLSTQTVKSLIGSIGAYYDIENDLAIRIISPAVTQNSFSGSYFYLILESIFAGFVLAFILNYFLQSLEKETLQKKSTRILPWVYKEEQKNVTVKQDSIERKIIFTKENTIPTFNKKATAPVNLPIAENNIFEISKVDEIEEKNPPLSHEATPEEVKERLNKLLSGKL
ncbi:MAG: hypothetical protein A2271_03980 [Candidatus Moranbacteria bacterium RIFOXYA12_FULL_35_19]|nr:MAG: hypothetical protein UR78_C0020G0004 [Candidatus Moranbacteria bacterium GW2011_GWF2_35_39]OGI30168.1 MAG: hypothetical protein A2343_04230 [Candidatus Moranbacteria bacterium RIFOXYB12_FULL_35_8]OGI33299.1 MAG: hypothetical protein A2489_01185 [Candidatus Moranbacteria bacterium RIFOXYC12_FULL_36_13]OGI36817.1 MAG: hypothetical protein A2271_03980 [Candidatus Moranbacteria bacterium RIFOXYA12_FULL_35_19]